MSSLNVKLLELEGSSLWVKTCAFSGASPLQCPVASEQGKDYPKRQAGPGPRKPGSPGLG